jgi:hypothetical protein
MHVYLSTNPRGDVFSKPERLPHFTWDNILFGKYDDSRTVSYDVNFPEVCPIKSLFIVDVSHYRS